MNLGAGGSEVGSRPVETVAGETVAETLGEIVWLMTQDHAGREMNVYKIEALVTPAVLSQRFHIQYAQVPDMRRPGVTTLQPVEVSVFEKPLTGTHLHGHETAIKKFSLRR